MVTPSSESVQGVPLLTTKLCIPPLHPSLVPRSRLIEQLDEGLHLGHKLTLVSAPAGFGKTTLVSEWTNALDCPVAWLSLDSADDDPGRFFAYFIDAMQKIDQRLGCEIESAMRSGQIPPAEVISTILINDILEMDGRFLLVMDDFHVIQDGFILQAMEKLVTNFPQPLHLVLLTREDPSLPLARLRANNQLTEIRAGDLRFTGGEVDRFLNEVMGLSLSQEDITTLEDRTEGWVVGLQLAGLSVRDGKDPSGLIAALSGSHRFILSYLTEQVLDRQPEEIRHFLLQTSILDKLNSDLCNAVTGREDSRSLLEGLFSANLFLIPLDDEHKWYRYHHLFADLLRDLYSTRQKDEATELHRRASRWYAQAGGERGTFAGEAIQHALAAGDYALVVKLLENHAPGMIMQGYAKTVHGWVQAIPAEWSLQSPRTDIAFAWMHLFRGAYTRAFPYLERLQGSLADSRIKHQLGEERLSLEAEWLVIQSLILYAQGKAKESVVTVTRALETAPEQDSHVRSLAYYALASARQFLEDYPRAVKAYQMAIQHSRAAENLVAEMMSTVGLGLMACKRGQLHLACEIAAPVSARVEREGTPPPTSAGVYGLLGQVYYQWGRVEKARGHVLRALQLSTLGGYSTITAYYRVLLSRLFEMEGDLESAAREIQQAVDLLQMEAHDDVRREVISQQVRVYLDRDRPAAAELALQGQGFSFEDGFSFPEFPSGRDVSHSLGLLYSSALRILLYRARARCELVSLRAGIEVADCLIAGALQGQYISLVLEALLLRAQMHAALGDDRDGRTDYVHALELAEPEGFISIFVEQGRPVAEALADLVARDELGAVQPDYVENILDAFSALRSPGVVLGESPALIEPLTDRELDVLRLMVKGFKYKEIAAKLFISLNTVRFHVKAIYGKLGVNNRTQAAERAHRLRLL
jgi:LuxR family maltose regulon positive regulatory protein